MPYKDSKYQAKKNALKSLFTDDTTVYLKQNDEIKKLFEILNKWCIVSGAKFNMKENGNTTYRNPYI